MYARLDKLRDDLKKAVEKRDTAEEKVKKLEMRLKEEESLQIVNEVNSYHLSPEQLAEFLKLAGSGKLEEMLSGKVAMPTKEAVDETELHVDREYEEKEEDFLNEE